MRVGSRGRAGDLLRTERRPSPWAAQAQVRRAVGGQVRRNSQSRARWRKGGSRVASRAAGGSAVAETGAVHIS